MVNLYYGSNWAGLKHPVMEDDDTIAKGACLVDNQGAAVSLAMKKHEKRGGLCSLYNVELPESLKLADLTDKGVLEVVYVEYLKILNKAISPKTDILTKLFAAKKDDFLITINLLENKGYDTHNVHEVIAGHTKLFTEALISMGYDGLIAYDTVDGVPIHKSYIIFDPKKGNVIKEDELHIK